MNTQNPLERAISQIKDKMVNCNDKYFNGLDVALEICERNYGESLKEPNPCEPARGGGNDCPRCSIKDGHFHEDIFNAPKRWEYSRESKEIFDMYYSSNIEREAFAVDDKYIYFKRLVPCDKEI